MHASPLIVSALMALASTQEEPTPEDKIPEMRIKTAYSLRREQLEADVAVAWLRYNAGTDSALVADLSYGFTDWLTGEVLLPLIRERRPGGDDHAGLGNVSLELKMSFPKDALPFRLAAGVRGGFVTSDPDLELGTRMKRMGMVSAGSTSDFKMYLAASPEIADGLSVHVQPWIDIARERHTVFGLSTAIEAQPIKSLSILLGLDGSFASGHSALWSIIPGLSYQWRDHLKIGVGVPVGLTDSGESEDVGVIIDVEIRF